MYTYVLQTEEIGLKTITTVNVSNKFSLESPYISNTFARESPQFHTSFQCVIEPPVTQKIKRSKS